MAELGTFAWHELMSNDVESSVGFYEALFGWEVSDEEPGPWGRRRRFAAHGRTIGSVARMDPSAGVPCHWVSDLAVSDVDDAALLAAALGGVVEEPPADRPGAGRTASIVDPWGAAFRPVRPFRDTTAPSAGPPEPGRFCWNELLSPDLERSGEFYRAIGGWSGRDVDPGGGGRRVVYARDGRDVAGIAALSPHGTIPPMWLLYVAVADVNGAGRRIGELGGRITAPPAVLPGIGTCAVACDATGATFGICLVR